MTILCIHVELDATIRTLCTTSPLHRWSYFWWSTKWKNKNGLVAILKGRLYSFKNRIQNRIHFYGFPEFVQPNQRFCLFFRVIDFYYQHNVPSNFPCRATSSIWEERWGGAKSIQTMKFQAFCSYATKWKEDEEIAWNRMPKYFCEMFIVFSLGWQNICFMCIWDWDGWFCFMAFFIVIPAVSVFGNKYVLRDIVWQFYLYTWDTHTHTHICSTQTNDMIMSYNFDYSISAFLLFDCTFSSFSSVFLLNRHYLLLLRYSNQWSENDSTLFYIWTNDEWKR